MTKKVVRMEQKYFIENWLLPCSLHSHRTANSSSKNWLCHFSALPTHHPLGGRHKKRSAFWKRKNFDLEMLRNFCTFVFL
jgi:hypothetical protein